MATKKKGKASNQKSKQTAKKAASSNMQIAAIVTFAVALFLLFVVFIKGQSVWTMLHEAMYGIFGLSAFAFPLILGTVAVILAMERADLKKKIITKLVEISSMVWLGGALIDVFGGNKQAEFTAYVSEAYKLGTEYKNCGVAGGIVSYILKSVTGFENEIGAIIILILLIAVILMITTGTTLISLFKSLSKPAKAITEQVEDTYKTTKERIENEREEKRHRKGEIKPIKDFDVDIPVDDIPEQRSRIPADLDPEQQKVVAAYYGEELPEEIEPMELDEALEAAEQEAEYEDMEEDYASDSESDSDVIPNEQIALDFQKETDEFKGTIEAMPEIKRYKFPPYDLLKNATASDSRAVSNEMETTAKLLVETLKTFGVETKIMDIVRGPAVTRYELQPKAGVKISKITVLADDIALNLAASDVRIEAPIPNKSAVGIEVPNKTTTLVGIRELIESTPFVASKSKLTVAMGKDIEGNAVVGDISKMPHGLIAGATGSGKSVCINSIIMSILYKATPEEVKLLLIDPKVVELGIYNGIPHLLVPVVTDPRKAAGALGWAVEEMEKRYKMFADRGVRDIAGYNRVVEKLEDEPDVKKMPHIVIIIDELADLMMTASKEVEDSINRIAAKARAAGMHLLIATQRPSVNVVTGTIKANVPTRIAFAVSSLVDSRTILDMGGAEKLLGKGDMLFSPMGSSKPRRVQGCFVSDEEVEDVVSFVKSGNTADYDDNVMEEIERQAAADKGKKPPMDEEEGNGDDPVLDEAIKVVVEMGMASTSLLQRKLKLGYARAARIVDMMEQRGIVGPYEGAKPRKVLITKEQLMEKEASEE